MGLSETILAAMIGALATVTTALFQIFTAFKARNKVDVRPKKGNAMRSVLAVLALMVASGAGGFLYSEFIKQRASEDMRAMRGELKELRTLIASRAEAARAEAAAVAQVETSYVATSTTTTEDVADSAESVVYVPACRSNPPTAACGEQEGQRIALCGTIPAYARVDRIQLFAQPDAIQHPWDQHQVSFEQDVGGARFTGNSFEYAQGADLKAVCVNFIQWSSEHPHIARIVVRFGFGLAPAAAPRSSPVASPEPATTPTQLPVVITAESPQAMPTTAAFNTSGSAQ